ncbi:glycosyl hydrolase family 71-domain-containing protein [Roridomyces roridus]|uniref:Glycosyl hydrolase family 71-domain-containing protein n=1 Tax=Roridomyces roridus TaxID=1738132 RepID=A0AAD7BCN8_9AGAR|nr:glycosyl hydrolase family 71-domain-containing protein [Roridomyces roridus]
MLITTAFLGLCAALSGANAHTTSIDKRQNVPRMVFAHFMIGIVSDRRSSADYDADMIRAKSYGIDAFALNIGVDSYTDQQLGYAYDSAAANGMKVFISYDFNWWNPNNAAGIGKHLAGYASRSAQLRIDGAALVSSFAGDGLDVPTLRSSAGTPIFFVPNFHPGQGNFNSINGALSWAAWPSNGDNKAPTSASSVSVADGDRAYRNALGGSKVYMAPVSPWFFTHYGPEVSYSKNWVFPSDLLWFQRWNENLALGPPLVEIVTWNDYGESHYVAPLSSKHTDDGNSKWVSDMPHDAWLDMAKPFIAAYKAGASSPNRYITQDQIIYWYRPTLSSLNCDSTDTTAGRPANNASGNYFEGRPNGWQTMQDAVFVVTLLTQPGTLTVTSGNQKRTFNAPAGAASFSVPMAVGRQSFALGRSGKNILAANSLRDISNVCPCGLYNFNAFTGRVPPTFVDQLGPDGLSGLTSGLRVSSCSPTPSLATSAPPYTALVARATNLALSASSTITTIPTQALSASASATPTVLHKRRNVHHVDS